MDLALLDALVMKAGQPSIHDRGRVWFEGASMFSLGDRDEKSEKTWDSEDAMCRSLLAGSFVQAEPRAAAVLHASRIAPFDGPALWQVSYPEHSMLRARGNGMLAVLDTSGLFADPEHGAAQMTILDATTGAVLATWLPPHGVTWARFENDALIVDDETSNASVCEPLTGRVLGRTEPGVRTKWQDALLPNIFHQGHTTSRLESPDGRLLWKRPGWVRSTARTHGLSIINSDDATVVEAVRDDGTTAWTRKGVPATVTDDTVWIEDGNNLRILDIETGKQLSKTRAPWGDFQLYALHAGWDASDGLVLVDDDTSLAMYPPRWNA